MKLLRKLKDISSSTASIAEQTGTKIKDRLIEIPFYRHLISRLENGHAEGKDPDNISAGCLQSIIDGLGDEVIITGPDYRIKQANNAVLRRLGKTMKDIEGQPCYKVSHNTDEPCRSPWSDCPIKRVMETGETVCTLHTSQGNQTSEEGERWIEIVASPLRDGAGRITEIIELYRDVSESRKLRREILRANRELLALNSISRALNQTLDLMSTIKIAVETMLDALEAEISWVKLADENGSTPAIHANRELPKEVLKELVQAVNNMALSEKTTSATYTIMAGKENGGAEQLWQFVVTPLRSKGITLGTAGVGTVRHPVDQQRIQLVDAMGHQISTAVERCKLYGEVQGARDLRGELLRKVITAQEEERRRIARELHDETGQALTALRLCLERLTVTSDSNTAGEFKKQLEQSLNLCHQADEEIDKLIFDLRPSLLDDLGLVEAIEFFIEARLTAAGIKGRLVVTGEERRLSSEREVSLFRIIQESINNIIKHAQAKNVTIKLVYKADQMEAWIEDNGCGFDVKHIINQQSTGRGLGLLGMKERISLIGGELSITSSKGKGTIIKAVIPLVDDGVKA